jgi:hypothetical protein
LPQPVLSLYTVRSSDRYAVREWLFSGVVSEVRDWIMGTESATPVRRDAPHHQIWTWTAELDPR